MAPATMATLCGTFHWVADRWKKQARYPEIRSFPEHYQACPPPIYNSVKKSEDEVFVAVEAVEIIIDIIEQVIGPRGDYIKELSQRWSDKIINMSFQRLRGWRNLRYQGVCTISQRIPHQYVATTFSGDPASRGECSVKWHNGNISVLVMVRGYNKIFEM